MEAPQTWLLSRTFLAVGVINPPLPDGPQGHGASLLDPALSRAGMWLCLRNNFNCRVPVGLWVGCGCRGQVGLQVGGSRFGKGRSRARADSRKEKLENQDWVKAVPGELRDGGVLLQAGMEPAITLLGKARHQKRSWKRHFGWKKFIFEGF